MEILLQITWEMCKIIEIKSRNNNNTHGSTQCVKIKQCMLLSNVIRKDMIMIL